MAWFWFYYCFLLFFFFETDSFASEIYTNIWAVKLRGNQREVEELAFKYGFVYDSHVSTMYSLSFRQHVAGICCY